MNLCAQLIVGVIQRYKVQVQVEGISFVLSIVRDAYQNLRLIKIRQIRPPSRIGIGSRDDNDFSSSRSL